METIKGFIEHFAYRNEENGYSVMTVVADGKSITCVGTVRGYSEGETIAIDGEFVIHPIYDKQLKITAIRSIPPEDRIAIVRYLGSGAIKGIGEALANRIVDFFGEDTFRVIEEEPERLVEVKGISARKAQEITNQLVAKRDMRDA
ncbi:MAG TPA: helix-hairpin-helix domain-containing protein, partial [Lachnospiraceae bacterium]|nr:helix-hairpin-helix domain-containing protein [Lachnospiraceae bacterium]